METFVFSNAMNKPMKQSKSRCRLMQVLLVFFIWSSSWVFAQAGGDHVTVPLSDPSRPALVKVHLLNGGITVKGHEGKDVLVEAHVRERSEPKAEGSAKHIPMTSTGLAVDEENNEVKISSHALQQVVDVTISVPHHTSLVLRTVNHGDIVVTGVEGELDVNDINGAVTLNNVSGNVVAHALNGRVLATMDRVDPQKPMAFSSLNGDIDVTFPVGLKANLNIRSNRGEVHSDFEMQVQSPAPQITEDAQGKGRGKYRVRVDRTIQAKINGGGPEIQIKNFNGDVYVRKAGAK